jgi:tetratricopeptide (TPR) repeat protein
MDNEEAIEKHKKAIELNTYLNWGNSLYRLEKYEEAIEKYSKAIELNPEYHEAYFNWGNSLYRLEKYEEAIEKYKKAIELNPKDPKAYLNWGNSLDSLGKYEEAREKRKEAAERNPDNVVFFNALKNAKEEGKKVIDLFLKTELLPDDEGVVGKIEGYETINPIAANIVLILYYLRYDTIQSKGVLVHYTKSDTALKILTQKNSKNEDAIVFRTGNINFRMYSSYYANDPEEGKILHKHLEIEEEEERIDHNCILSFFSEEEGSYSDSLPTWQVYGDKCKGVAISIKPGGVIKNCRGLAEGVDNNSVKVGNTTRAGLYKVFYLEEQSSVGAEEKAKLNKIKALLEKEFTGHKIYNNIEKELKELKIKESLENIKARIKEGDPQKDLLGYINHLFKSNHYKHENEVRLLFHTNDCEALQFDKQTPPSLYYNYESLTLSDIDRVILGTNSEKSYEYLLKSIAPQAIKEKIKRSKIKYRS